MQLTTPHLPLFKITVSPQLIPLQKTDIVTKQNAEHKHANAHSHKATAQLAASERLMSWNKILMIKDDVNSQHANEPAARTNTALNTVYSLTPPTGPPAEIDSLCTTCIYTKM